MEAEHFSSQSGFAATCTHHPDPSPTLLVSQWLGYSGSRSLGVFSCIVLEVKVVLEWRYSDPNLWTAHFVTETPSHHDGHRLCDDSQSMRPARDTRESGGCLGP